MSTNEEKTIFGNRLSRWHSTIINMNSKYDTAASDIGVSRSEALA